MYKELSRSFFYKFVRKIIKQGKHYEDERLSLHTRQVAHQAGAYPGFRSLGETDRRRQEATAHYIDHVKRAINIAILWGHSIIFVRTPKFKVYALENTKEIEGKYKKASFIVFVLLLFISIYPAHKWIMLFARSDWLIRYHFNDSLCLQNNYSQQQQQTWTTTIYAQQHWAKFSFRKVYSCFRHKRSHITLSSWRHMLPSNTFLRNLALHSWIYCIYAVNNCSFLLITIYFVCHIVLNVTALGQVVSFRWYLLRDMSRAFSQIFWWMERNSGKYAM